MVSLLRTNVVLQAREGFAQGRITLQDKRICDHGTYVARHDDLMDGKDGKIDVTQVDVSMNGIELQDREFFAAIREGREPNASVSQVLPAYRTLDRLEQTLEESR